MPICFFTWLLIPDLWFGPLQRMNFFLVFSIKSRWIMGLDPSICFTQNGLNTLES